MLLLPLPLRLCRRTLKHKQCSGRKIPFAFCDAPTGVNTGILAVFTPKYSHSVHLGRVASLRRRTHCGNQLCRKTADETSIWAGTTRVFARFYRPNGLTRLLPPKFVLNAPGVSSTFKREKTKPNYFCGLGHEVPGRSLSTLHAPLPRTTRHRLSLPRQDYRGHPLRAHLSGRKKINFSQVFAGQAAVGIKEVHDDIWLVQFYGL